VKGDAGLRLAWERDGAWAKGRYGEWAKVVPIAFKDEDDDEYEDDGLARGLA
jgi:hypothetical protein